MTRRAQAAPPSNARVSAAGTSSPIASKRSSARLSSSSSSRTRPRARRANASGRVPGWRRRRFALDRGPVTEHAERVEAGKHGTHSEPRRDPRLDADERLESLEIAADEREPHLGAGQHRPVTLELHLAGGFLQLPRVLPVADVLCGDCAQQQRPRVADARGRGFAETRSRMIGSSSVIVVHRPAISASARIAIPWTR